MKTTHLFAFSILILCLFAVNVNSANSIIPDFSPAPDKKANYDPAPPRNSDKGPSRDISEYFAANPDDADQCDEDTERDSAMFDDDDFYDTEGGTSRKAKVIVQFISSPSPPGPAPSLVLQDSSDKGKQFLFTVYPDKTHLSYS